VSWSPAVAAGGTFAAFTTYTATITLTAKTGYTLQGVTANYFTVAGARSSSNAANSGIVTAVFPRTTIDMVSVPGGTFEFGKEMGTPSMGDIGTVTTETVYGFYMSTYEITQAQYEAVMGTNPSTGSGVGDNYPVYNVSFYDILVFCNKLSAEDGLTPAYRIFYSTNTLDWGSVPTGQYDPIWDSVFIDGGANGYRLPDEIQWEYAAKGGSGSPGYTYAGSNTPGDVAWYSNNSGNAPHEVGTRVPNILGLYDMSGNVSEWTQSLSNFLILLLIIINVQYAADTLALMLCISVP